MPPQTLLRVAERPLDVVLRPGSPADAAYRSAVLAPGFQAEHGLDLQYLGGKTIPALTFTNVYLGTWNVAERQSLDHALAAAMADKRLNNVLAQYFPAGPVRSTFAGSRAYEGTVTARGYRDLLEAIVSGL